MPWRDIEFRRAWHHSIDRKFLVDVVWEGGGRVPTSNTFLVEGNPFHNPKSAPDPYLRLEACPADSQGCGLQLGQGRQAGLPASHRQEIYRAGYPGVQARLHVGRFEDAAAVGKERQGITMEAFRELFRPGRINRLELKNRFIMAAAGNAMADDEGFVTDRAIDYCVERAKGGVGLVIVKFTSVIANARGSRNHMAAFDDKFIPRLRDLSSAVQRHGARVALQLGHHGNDLSLPRRQSSFAPGEQPVVAPSPVPYVATGVDSRRIEPGRDR